MTRAESERNGYEGEVLPALLVATDGSEAAVHAGERAAVLARELGAKLFAVNVVDPHETFQAGIYYPQIPGDLEREGHEAHRRGRRSGGGGRRRAR